MDQSSSKAIIHAPSVIYSYLLFYTNIIYIMYKIQNITIRSYNIWLATIHKSEQLMDGMWYFLLANDMFVLQQIRRSTKQWTHCSLPPSWRFHYWSCISVEISKLVSPTGEGTWLLCWSCNCRPIPTRIHGSYSNNMVYIRRKNYIIHLDLLRSLKLNQTWNRATFARNLVFERENPKPVWMKQYLTVLCTK